MSIGRQTTHDVLDGSIQQIVNDIRIMVRDMQCEFSNHTSEEDFVREISHRSNIGIEVARFVAGKSDNEFGIFQIPP